MGGRSIRRVPCRTAAYSGWAVPLGCAPEGAGYVATMASIVSLLPILNGICLHYNVLRRVSPLGRAPEGRFADGLRTRSTPEYQRVLRVPRARIVRSTTRSTRFCKHTHFYVCIYVDIHIHVRLIRPRFITLAVRRTERAKPLGRGGAWVR